MPILDRSLKKYQRSNIHFAICNSCFWCASYISTNLVDTNYRIPTKCPNCHEGNIEPMPIAQNEGYTFDYNSKRGVILEFSICHE